jgi:hypothetical protein
VNLYKYENYAWKVNKDGDAGFDPTRSKEFGCPSPPEAYEGPVAVMAKKPVNIEVMEQGGERFVLTTYNDGTVVRCRVDPNKKPTRKPRKPFVRVWSEKRDGKKSD